MVKRTYQPNKRKHSKVHGFRKRMSTKNGRKVLARRRRDLSVEKAYRIKRNSEFQKIYKKGKSVANRQFVVYTLNNEYEHFRLGISVSKKIGNAVTRNRIKRAIRENFKVHKQDMISKDIIVIARQPAKNMSTLEIQGSLEHVLKIAKVFNKRIK